MRSQNSTRAIEAIAKKALERKTGARGLRAIMESTMMDMMFSLPSEEQVEHCLITRDTVEKGEPPILTYGDRVIAKKPAARKLPKKNSGEIA